MLVTKGVAHDVFVLEPHHGHIFKRIQLLDNRTQSGQPVEPVRMIRGR